MSTIAKSRANAALMIGVCVPPVALVMWLQSSCDFASLSSAAPPLISPEWWCYTYYSRPAVFVNVVYGLVVDAGFWLIYLAQGSTWLIDPHWQIIPACIALCYGASSPARCVVACASWVVFV